MAKAISKHDLLYLRRAYLELGARLIQMEPAQGGGQRKVKPVIQHQELPDVMSCLPLLTAMPKRRYGTKAPLQPRPGFLQRLEDTGEGSCVVIDVLGLTAFEIGQVWSNLPKQILDRGVGIVLITDTELDRLLTYQGAVIEYLAARPYCRGPEWDQFFADHVEFIRAKYGADRILNGRLFLAKK